MNGIIHDDKGVVPRAHAVCRLPIEVLRHISPVTRNPEIRIWLGQGSGREGTRQDLLDYAKSARGWADKLEEIAG